LITDPAFYLVAIPAVILFGIAKGGFGGGLGVMAVPLMALVVTPVKAAAILLPILCIMDLVSLRAYRGRWVLSELRLLLPASLAGIGIGTWMFGVMSPGAIRLMLGLIAVVFTLHHWLQTVGGDAPQKRFPPSAGVFAAAAAGFTSFIAHAGGPPITMYLLRRHLDRTAFVATTVVFFAVVNYVKLVPYAWLGQLDGSNLYTSLVLAPLAPLGVATGVWLHNRVTDRLFFRLAYTLLFVVGVKLIYDGVAELGWI
jgi:uncharacterized protein